MLNIKHNGMTLIEVLIGLLVGIILTFGMVVFYTNTSRISNETLTVTRLDFELQTAMKMMKDDIRRAGYTANASGLVGQGIENPFLTTGVSDITAPTANCILFTYDLNMDGTLPAVGTAGSDERYGYRVNNQVLQTRAASDPNFDCNAGTWENLTNPNLIQVTGLTFTITENVQELDPGDPATATIRVRQVTIAITGQLASDAAIQRTITSEVRVRNDKYQP